MVYPREGGQAPSSSTPLTTALYISGMAWSAALTTLAVAVAAVASTPSPRDLFVTGFVSVDTLHMAGDLFYAFAAPKDRPEAPLILWLQVPPQGGPGSSGTQSGLLREIGPVACDPSADNLR